VEQLRNMQVQRALVELQLNTGIADVSQRETGLAVELDRGTAKLQLGARVSVRPDAIGGGQRAVDGSGDPVVHAVGLDRNIAAHVIETRYARRWIAGKRRRSKECNAKDRKQQTPMRSHGWAPETGRVPRHWDLLFTEPLSGPVFFHSILTLPG